MKSQIGYSVAAYGILSLAAGITFVLPESLSLSTASAYSYFAPPDTIRLGGTVRDFRPDHPDFAINDSGDMGHVAGNVAPTLGDNGRPVFTSAGRRVSTQWYDKDANPIQPNAGPGLPWGHFDIDVYNSSDIGRGRRTHHQHEFDDRYDTTYVDLASDATLLFDDTIGSEYPNDLRLEFVNVHNGGGGTYAFEAGDGLQTGSTADGFTATFTPSELTELRVSFIALSYLKPTAPGIVKSDQVDRDDSFIIRMYDVVTDDLMYEFTAYHHYRRGEVIPEVPAMLDACGTEVSDIQGVWGNPASGGVNNASSFNQWFRDDLGTNMSTGHEIELQRDADGVYQYYTDSFFPIDGQLYGNGSDRHNNFFTYSIEATFTYNECTAQFFEFESNDDAWVFIDDQLVLDIGGTATPSRQHVALDRLGLVDGQEYTLSFFYAHRRESFDSLFHMRTNLELGGTPNPPTVSPFYD